MVLQDLGRRINAAVSDLTRSNNLDEKVSINLNPLSP
jgi:signal recognition particle subunit SRP54